MTSVSDLDLGHDYEGDAGTATERIHTASLDADLDAIQAKINRLLAALALVIRDDDTLGDQTVHPRCLDDKVIDLIGGDEDLTRLEIVDLVADSNITLSGEQSIDGVTTSTSRVLVAGQTTASQNGIYVSAAGAWTRATDMAAAAVLSGMYFVEVESGDIYEGCRWELDACDADLTVATDDLDWAWTGLPGGGGAGSGSGSTTIVYSSEYDGDLAAAVAAIGSDEKTLCIDTESTLAGNLSTPATLHITASRFGQVDLDGNTWTHHGTCQVGPFKWLVTSSGTWAWDGVMECVYPQWFGATGDGSTDDTDAVQDAIDMAAGWPTDEWPDVVFLPGTYRVHEILLATSVFVALRGIDPGRCVLHYNGTGGAGTYIIKKVGSPSGATGRGGFSGLELIGYDATGGGIAHAGIDLADDGASGVARSDWGFRIQNMHIRRCMFGIKYGGIVNQHLDQMRFDGIGWYCINIVGAATSENRPFTLTRWTYDNTDTGAALTALSTEAGGTGTDLGRGLIRVEDFTGILMAIRDGRPEINIAMIQDGTWKPCIVCAEYTSGNLPALLMENVCGFFTYYGGDIVWCPDKEISLRMRQVSITYSMLALHAEGYTPDVAIPHAYNGDLTRQVYAQSMVGGRIGNIAREPRPNAPTATSFHPQSPNDEVEYLGYRFRAKDSLGHSRQDAQTLIASVDVTLGATSVVCTTNELRYIAEGFAMKIPGAGVAGADLVVTVTAVDRRPAQRLITWDTATSTGVTGVSITNVPHTWEIVDDSDKQVVAYAATVYWLLKDGTYLQIEPLTGNVLIQNPTNTYKIRRFTVEVEQDATGSRTVNWGSMFKVATAVSATASTRTIWHFYYDIDNDEYIEQSAVAGVPA